MEGTLQITRIDATLIAAGRNDRQHFGQAAQQELADSIERNGLLEPMVVRPVGDGYQIVAGERRFRAMTTILGWTHVPAIIREFTDEEAAEAMFAENFDRVDLTPIEEALAYQKWIETFGWTVQEIAEKRKTNVWRINNRLRMLQLIPEAQHLISVGQLGAWVAEALVDLDANRQLIALRAYQAKPEMGLDGVRGMAAELHRQQVEEPLFSMNVEEFDLSSLDSVTVKRANRAELVAMIERLAEFAPADAAAAAAALLAR